MTTKYIFITGGVVSSLGKGIISASIGKLLQARGYKITIQKFDPYINIDPGTLNPYEHGECYVTDDGFETDLDLGHYERFTGIRTTRNNSITTGRIYKTVIDRERRGDYLGKTIQVVPHITDEIKRRMLRLDVSEESLDFVITEVGGTIGDIESAPFMEAIRQLRWQLGRDAVCVHLTYVPYLKAAGELKTKPTQHSVKELQGMGIQPDILVLRTEHHLDQTLRTKVASFCNVDPECVVQSEDLPSIYDVPVNMQRQGLDTAILRKIGIPAGEAPDMHSWHYFLERQRNADREISVALVGKYDLQDAYKSIRESLSLAGIYDGAKVKIDFISSEEMTRENVAGKLDGYAGVVTGLAWTSVGGEILFIETSLSKGKGSKLTLTGNLGDVMKESAVLALEYVKAHAQFLDIDYRFFDNYNIHIHVPEGATPKDGPSAGITIATSIASALTQRKVRMNTAMTGEITLRGKVLPVGGIKEKILAAKRAGITDIIICRDNRKDIDEIPEVYVKGLTFHYVENIKEVWDFALTNEIVSNPVTFEIDDKKVSE